tara:strand:- start:103 stop:288 length:186 start_codon:yes stop_codon:yes gene_type:complete
MAYKKSSGFKMKSSPTKLFGSRKRRFNREEKERKERKEERREYLEHNQYVMGVQEGKKHSY